MHDQQKLRDIFVKLESLFAELKASLLEEPPAAPLNFAKPAAAAAPAEATQFGDFESLREALKSDKWPEAVNPRLICDPNSAADKADRGRGIVELMVEEDLRGLRFLDYGCGEGYCATAAAGHAPAVAVGYEPAPDPAWERHSRPENLLFTSNFAEVQARGPFDVIVLFDVIDHLKGESPAAALEKVAGLLAPKGKVYVRTHPFVSRHGTHLYHDLNRAFVHLVFTPDELRQLIPQSRYAEPSANVTTPLMTYERLFTGAGLQIAKQNQVTEKVEPFFKIPKIAERIMRNTGMSSFPDFQMGIQFVDYILHKK